MRTLHRIHYFFGKSAIFGACLIITGLLFASQALASSVVLRSSTSSTEVGKTFTVPITIDPGSSPQYTAGIYVAFPPDLLEVTSFNLGPNWLAVIQPGYDSTDNAKGELIKTGGFPKGFTSPVIFGTVTFRSKASGESAISIGPDSFVLGADNKSSLVSRPEIRITAAGQATQTVETTTSVPLLPNAGTSSVAERKNLFDISLAPAQSQNTSRPGVVFYVGLVVLAVVLGIIGRSILVWVARRRSRKKIMYDNDFKK